MQPVPEWDKTEPTTLGELTNWFIEAEGHLDEPNMKDYVAGRWSHYINSMADAQGVTAGWLAYMVSSLVLERTTSGEQT